MTNSLPVYKDAKRSVEERVNDLLSRMTLREKAGQLMALNANGDGVELVRKYQPASFFHIWGEALNASIDEAAKTRLGIPILFAEDCIHGHSFWKGATIFPTQLAMACSWNPELLEKVAAVTAKEVKPTGVQWTYSPVLCLTRDLRWGRVGETFGEDPFVIGVMASAMIRGYQGKGIGDPNGILATAKHYAGYSETQGGRDASEADISRRKLRSYFLPPFEQAVRAGCMTFMTGYQSMEGLPSTANRWLLREVLKDEWGFEGILVTDYNNVGSLVIGQKICATYKEAAALAVRCGNDLMMHTFEFLDGAIEAVEEGLLKESELDDPVKRVLALKFKMGLFEDPRRADLQRALTVIKTPEHKALNLEMARQSLVLLKNDGVLPLVPEKVKRIAVVGPNADDDLSQLGDWSLGSCQYDKSFGKHPRECTATVLDGIKGRAKSGCEVVYAKGCANNQPAGEQEIAEVVKLAANSDVIVCVVGDTIQYFGEWNSTATLELQGGQIRLLDELAKLDKPLIVVLINSKPLVLPQSAQNAAAIIELFNPGMSGGTALAEALFGDINPSGKLTISFPYHVGQQPIYYSQVRGQHGDRYADLTQSPLFAFGYGLSYTTYRYEDLQVSVDANRQAKVTVSVTNTGKRAGDEIVQVYVSDEVTSATWVNMELKGFARVNLEPGESKRVQVELPSSSFSFVNANGERVIEPGVFKVYAGSSSRKEDLLAAEIEIAG
ncbi:MAG: glycoside hydrolase family 3 C-terminal domain-containing protein [Verrucomicrobiales bacterium]|jgi:beta-glucosidase|nr:glycoside hydrolase family 3 C-terminal domain-containing protein [Verrucomicrobiales bacterium]